MKVYTAAPYAARELVRGHREHLLAAGLEPVSSWVHETVKITEGTKGAAAALTDTEVRHHAKGDFRDIRGCALLLHYTAAYCAERLPEVDPAGFYSGGRHVETGYALARGIPVVVLGEAENVFQRAFAVGTFSSLARYLAWHRNEGYY